MSDYNKQISQLTALAHATSQEIANDEKLQLGEKFLYLQQIEQGFAPMLKNMETIEDDLDSYAKENLHDLGDKESKKIKYKGLEMFIKYAYPKDKLDGKKLLKEYENICAEANLEVNTSQFYLPSTPTKKIIKQSILNK